MALYSLARTFGGEVREGLRIAQDASAIARELDDPELILGTNATYHIGMVGDLHAALISVDEMLAIARENPGAGNLTVGFSLHSWAYQFRGISVLAPLGRLSDARADLARARDLAHEFDDSESLQWAVGSMAILGWYTGDGGDSLSTARQAVDIAERQGAAFNRLVAHTVMALAYMCRREWDEAIEAGTRALEIMEETGTGLQYEPWIRAHLATARLEAGEPLEAIALARVGVDLARKRNVAIFELDCLVALARALLLAHGAVARSEVRDLAAQADACIARTGAQFYSAWVEWIRADVAALEGETAAAEAHLGEARERFAAAGADGWVREIEARRERLHA
jgi:tetratricopeptide (TPR) repeat protein